MVLMHLLKQRADVVVLRFIDRFFITFVRIDQGRVKVCHGFVAHIASRLRKRATNAMRTLWLLGES